MTPSKVTSVYIPELKQKVSLRFPEEFIPTWKEFLRLAKMEGRSPGSILYEHIHQYVQQHSPGNPQLPMTKFTQPQLVEKRCEHPGCTQIATWVDYPRLKTAKPKIYSCMAHHKHALENQLLHARKSKKL